MSLWHKNYFELKKIKKKQIKFSPFLAKDKISILFFFFFTADRLLAQCLVPQSCLTLCNCIDCSPPGSSGHGDSPGKNTGVGCMPFSRGSSQPRDQTQVSCIDWATRKVGVGSLTLFQEIFLTQESNWDLLHCRRILYQLSYQERHQENPQAGLPPVVFSCMFTFP